MMPRITDIMKKIITHREHLRHRGDMIWPANDRKYN
jgi:hypothetical protein